MIPQVNAGVTDRNREQSKRICELSEGGYAYMDDRFGGPVADSLEHKRIVHLPNGSLTLDMVIGMIKERGWKFTPDDSGERRGGYWARRRADMVWEDMGYVKDAHGLTENADSLIKMLELSR